MKILWSKVELMKTSKKFKNHFLFFMIQLIHIHAFFILFFLVMHVFYFYKFLVFKSYFVMLWFFNKSVAHSCCCYYCWWLWSSMGYVCRGTHSSNFLHHICMSKRCIRVINSMVHGMQYFRVSFDLKRKKI